MWNSNVNGLQGQLYYDTASHTKGIHEICLYNYYAWSNVLLGLESLVQFRRLGGLLASYFMSLEEQFKFEPRSYHKVVCRAFSTS